MDKWLGEFVECEIARHEKYEAVRDIYIQQMRLFADLLNDAVTPLENYNKGIEDKNPVSTGGKCLSNMMMIKMLEVQKQVIIAKPIRHIGAGGYIVGGNIIRESSEEFLINTKSK
jgi:hypothetical protein